MSKLETETDQQVLRKLIFAYGSLVRGNHIEFIQDQDIVRLANVYKKSSDMEFRRKCVYIMSDFADPEMQFISTNESTTTESEGQDDDKNTTTTTTTTTEAEKEKANVGPWCETLQQENKTNWDWEIIERAMELLHESYPETCTLNKNNVKDEL